MGIRNCLNHNKKVQHLIKITEELSHAWNTIFVIHNHLSDATISNQQTNVKLSAHELTTFNLVLKVNCHILTAANGFVIISAISNSVTMTCRKGKFFAAICSPTSMFLCFVWLWNPSLLLVHLHFDYRTKSRFLSHKSILAKLPCNFPSQSSTRSAVASNWL